MTRCLCGCKRAVPSGAKFIEGHQKIWEENQQGKCGCGCGEPTLYSRRFILGHHNRVPEYKNRARKINLGSNNPAYGKPVSEETREKRSKSIKKKYKEDPEWKARRDKASKDALQRPEVKQRISEGLMGRPVGEETREKIRKSNKETWSDEKRREGHSELMKEVMNQPETRAKLAEVHSSEEWREKMSKISTEFWSDPEGRELALRRMEEVRQTEEYKRNLRENIRRGEAHPRWKGGYVRGPYGPDFTPKLKQAVRERDNFTCMLCGVSEEESGSAHSVHHIDYDKFNNAEDNLITLCISCHGKTNADRSNWQDFFTELMELAVAI